MDKGNSDLTHFDIVGHRLGNIIKVDSKEQEIGSTQQPCTHSMSTLHINSLSKWKCRAREVKYITLSKNKSGSYIHALTLYAHSSAAATKQPC